MKRTSLLAGTAMAIALMGGVSAQAATCGITATQILCSAPDGDPIVSLVDDIEVVVEDTASVVSNGEDETTVALGGDGVTIENAGLIENTNTEKGGYAITGSGDGMTVTNTGTIASGDRGIEMLDGSGLNVINQAGGTITARRQTVRSGVDTPGARVENHGTIFSSEGRALQLRSFGATVINYGNLIGAEEVVEARGNFTLENHGIIALSDPSIEDEDGVQFASGTVNNYGLIAGSDDGIDLDEGLIVNHLSGVIRSTSATPDSHSDSAIDIDPEYEDGINPVRASGSVEIINRGLIEGPRAIGADDAATNKVTITNSGTLRGRLGTAVQLAPGQGDSRVNLLGESRIYGDVLFGGGDDVVSISTITSGLLSDDVFDGGLGMNSVIFTDTGLSAFATFIAAGDTVKLSFLSDGDTLFGSFVGFSSWSVEGHVYTTDELSRALAPVPLPAALPMLLVALGGIAAVRRRRRS